MRIARVRKPDSATYKSSWACQELLTIDMNPKEEEEQEQEEDVSSRAGGGRGWRGGEGNDEGSPVAGDRLFGARPWAVLNTGARTLIPS